MLQRIRDVYKRQHDVVADIGKALGAVMAVEIKQSPEIVFLSPDLAAQGNAEDAAQVVGNDAFTRRPI